MLSILKFVAYMLIGTAIVTAASYGSAHILGTTPSYESRVTLSAGLLAGFCLMAVLNCFFPNE